MTLSPMRHRSIRRALLLLTPLVLIGLVVYAAWEPMPEPIPHGQDAVSDASDSGETLLERPIAEGDRVPLGSGVGSTWIPGGLSIEDYREAHEMLVQRHARSAWTVANLHRVIEEARSELIRKREFARLETSYIDELKYRLALAMLEAGQFEQVSWPPGSAAGTSLSLKVNGSFLWFEFLPRDFPELFAVMDRRVQAQEAVAQFQCDEFNRMPFHDREARIRSHLEANSTLEILEQAVRIDHLSSKMRKDLRKRVLPSFMVIDEITYTVRPQ